MKQCKHPTCGDVCRREKKPKKVYQLKRSSIKKAPAKRNGERAMSRLKELAREAFNGYIRERDKRSGCISCGTGPVENAGHYYSDGHYSAVRYNEVNVNGQCIRCNKFLHGNLIHYRNGLIKKYGPQRVALLESVSRKSKKYSRVELETIITFYKNETLKLKSLNHE